VETTSWRNCKSEISAFFLARRICCRALSILKFFSRGWVRPKDSEELKAGLKLVKTLFVSCLLLLKLRLKTPPVGMAWLSPKFQVSVVFVTLAPPANALLAGFVTLFLLRFPNK